MSAPRLPWFRFYAETLNDPKVQKLPAAIFKGWVNVLCLASDCDGYIPPLPDIAFALRLDPDAAEALVDDLIEAELVELNGAGYVPHNWDKRQYKSDRSTDRVVQFRARQKKTR